MSCAGTPASNSHCSAAWQELKMTTALPEAQYNDLVELVGLCCDAPLAIISLENAPRQCYKARNGHTMMQSVMDLGFCSHVMEVGAPVFCIDASLDEHFCTNSFVTNQTQLRAYAGCPIFVPDTDICLGALAVADIKPRPDFLWKVGEDNLQLLARQVAHMVCLHAQEWRKMNEFVARISHELRTPLSGILGVASLLQDKLQTDAEVSEGLRSICASAEYNLQTLNELLDFAKLDAGKMELESLTFDLRDCVEAVFMLLPSTHMKPEVVVGYEMPQDIELIGDPHRLKQVLLNLMSNALKFTHKGSVILTITVEPTTDDQRAPCGHNFIRFEVRDTGIGVSAEDAHMLFKPFSQARCSIPRTYGGTGLGLVISRSLCEAMGGTMWLDSTPGQGSVFCFTILAPSECQPPPTPFQDKRVLVVDPSEIQSNLLVKHCTSLMMEVSQLSSMPKPWTNSPPLYDLLLIAAEAIDGTVSPPTSRWVLIGSQPQHLPEGWTSPLFTLHTPVMQRALLRQLHSSGDSAEQTLPAAAANLQQQGIYQGITALLVDDNDINLKVLAGILRRLGCITDTARDGSEAIKAVGLKSYDLVFMDLEMPVMNGFEATHVLKRQERPPYIVAITATPVSIVRAHCLKSGMDDVVEKPFRVDGISRALAKFTTKPNVEEDSCDDTPGPSTPVENSPRDPQPHPYCHISLPEDPAIHEAEATLDLPLHGFRMLSSLRNTRAGLPPLSSERTQTGLTMTPKPPTSRLNTRRSSIFRPGLFKRSSI